MKISIQIIFIAASSLFLGGCKWVDYHPYDAHISGGTNVNRSNIRRIEESFKDSESIRFVWMGDSQRWYDENVDFVNSVNARDDIDFVIHGGDISDFGMTKEFEIIHRIMSKLSVPYVALAGNHDLIGNGLKVFEKIYGPIDFSFIAGRTKFLCLNTNVLEFEADSYVPNFGFIFSELGEDTEGGERDDDDDDDDDDVEYVKTVVAMHAPPGSEQFNNYKKDDLHRAIKRFPSLQFCLYAHNHRLEINDFFEDGTIYYGCASMKERSYMVFTLTPQSYNCEVVYF